MGAIASQITGVSVVCSNVCLRHRSKKTPKLGVTGLCGGGGGGGGDPPVTSRFPSQRVSNAENVSISGRHRGIDALQHRCSLLNVTWHRCIERCPIIHFESTLYRIILNDLWFLKPGLMHPMLESDCCVWLDAPRTVRLCLISAILNDYRTNIKWILNHVVH